MATKKDNLKDGTQSESKPTRIALYARVGSADARETLKQQTDFLTELIKKDKNCVVVEMYADVGSSRRKHKRPSFKRMLNDAKKRKFDFIVVKNISRFGRDIRVVSKALRQLKKCGVGVYFANENINTQTRKGQFIFTVMGI